MPVAAGVMSKGVLRCRAPSSPPVLPFSVLSHVSEKAAALIRRTKRALAGVQGEENLGKKEGNCTHVMWSTSFLEFSLILHVKSRGTALIGQAVRALAGVQGKENLGKEEEIALT